MPKVSAMIASKPEAVSVSHQTQLENTGLPVNIFAGLSFPEVPTHDLYPPSYVAATATDQCDSTSVKNSSESDVTTDYQLRAIIETPTNHRVSHTAQSLASLYAINDTEAVGIYPDLPVSIVSMTYSHGTRYDSGTGSAVADEIESMNVPTENYNSESSCPPADAQNVETCLVTDLMSENARLSSELEDLKKSLATKYPSTVTAPGAAASATSSSAALGVQQVGMMRGERDEENHGLLQASTDSSQLGVKYVCCGNCRMWLSAPINALLVKCPGCDSVNRCDGMVRRKGNC